ncbi:hypothetical protein CY34DRAFT_142123 [Suillus luteus UH-Slu-Lm8-n1]|uniref:Uncharacterized protein n=1 Tax=Suillus luteus UH-Slu-Lm8-n1 TaxID=930992 RepID=A0A0D0BH21_9AGAM|nr:hypothetical protein CY34DRAFT_142123 [Suillus luteus UH-Slu-Lm8-n1]
MRSLPTIIVLSRENYATVGSSPHVTVYKRLHRLAKSECCLFFSERCFCAPPRIQGIDKAVYSFFSSALHTGRTDCSSFKPYGSF